MQMKKAGQVTEDLPRFRRRDGEGHFIQGYWRSSKDGLRLLEHRRVMSEFLGRSLLADETVHHLNGNRSDNRLENLELWSTSQPPGQRVVDKIQWAKEILSRYEPGSLR